MNRFRLVLCLTLLVSSLGAAQTPEPDEEPEWSPYTPSPAGAPAPPPLVPADPPMVPAPPAEPEPSKVSEPRGEIIPREVRPELSGTGSAALRLVGGPFAGIIGSVGGAMAGAIVSGFILLPFCLDSLRDLESNRGCLVGFSALASVGATLGATGTVYLMGEVFGGRGRFLPALLGGLVGTSLGAVSGTVSGNTLVLVLGLGIGPIIGSVVGYEVSHSLEEPVAEPRRGGGIEVMPMVSATPRGGILGGLVGRF
ncbi:MAG TPA: hypothetical protein VF815_14355 [Myxococcaceae bacterium]|jgi:hypothetical protein